MTHLDEGQLLALRDGEWVEETARAHLEACVSCRDALVDAEARSRAIEGLLDSLDERGAVRQEGATLARAKSSVRARLDQKWAGEVRRTSNLRHLRRAAAILAVTAGAAYALPGSPLPRWLGLGATPSGHEAPRPATTTSDPDGNPGQEQEMVLIPATDGIEIFLDEVANDVEVEMVWLEGETARVAAGPGARYSMADGIARARVPTGPVRVGVPRSAPTVALSINGRMVFQGTSEESTTSNVVRRSPDRIVFRVSRP